MKRVAAGSLVLSFCMAVAAAVLEVLYGKEWNFEVAMIACFTVFAAIGALILWRKPHHAIGRIYVGGAFLGTLGALMDALTDLDRAGATMPVGVWWLSKVLEVLPLVVLVPLPLLVFPTGNLPSKRWRPVLWAAIAAIGALMLQPAFLAQRFGDPATMENPLGIEGANDVLTRANAYGLTTLTIVLVTTVVSLFRRNRRATGAKREQYRWLAWAGVWTFVLVFLAGPGVYSNTVPGLTRVLLPFTGYLFAAAVSMIPLAIAVAILRYRLWDIDRIISRTVSYAAVTAIVVGIYGVVAVVVPSRFVAADGTPDLLIAAGTLLAAAAFGPVRRRVQSRVDRRFNRERFDASKTIDAFTARLREQVDIDALGVELREVITRTMHPTHVTLWMRP